MEAEQLEFDFSDGKNREKEGYSQSELEKLLGVDKVNPYGTFDKDTFASKVETMGIDEMRNLAVRVGVMPTSRQGEMRKRLLNNFDSYIAQHRAVQTFPKPGVDPNSPEYKKLQDEGLIGFD